MQLNIKKSTYVENKDVHERRASQLSTILRDIKRLFTRPDQNMAIVRSISVLGRVAQSVTRSGLDLIISSNI
jgi:hypothetical protein